MPIRFRRTFTLFPGVKINVSKGGMSVTVGRKGFHLNFSRHGVKETVGLPGSGLSQSSYLFKNDPGEEKEKRDENEVVESEDSHRSRKRARTVRTKRETRQDNSSAWGFFLFIFIALFLIYVGGVFLGVLPPSNLITQFLQLLTHWAQQAGL